VEKCDQFTNRQLHAWEPMHGNQCMGTNVWYLPTCRVRCPPRKMPQTAHQRKDSICASTHDGRTLHFTTNRLLGVAVVLGPSAMLTFTEMSVEGGGGRREEEGEEEERRRGEEEELLRKENITHDPQVEKKGGQEKSSEHMSGMCGMCVCMCVCVCVCVCMWVWVWVCEWGCVCVV